MRKSSQSIIMAALFALAGSSLPGGVRADETSGNISIAKFISNLKIAGDLRLRQENFWKSSPGQMDRSRQRFRLRLGIEPKIQDVTVGLRFASGTGEQVSTNQSLDNLSSQKAIFIDLAYLQWKAFEWLKLGGGRMPNPFWRLYSSDILWDDDVNPEGFAEQLEYGFGERLTGFVNLSQIVLDEDAGTNKDQWLFGYQLGAKTKWFQESRWNVAGTLYQFMNETDSDFGAGAINEGNTRVRTTNTLRSTFTIVQLTSEFATKIGALPVSLQADYAANVAPNGVLLSSSSEKAGYQVGVILGKASAAKSWEAAYFFKWLEQDATVADLADSDFGDGGTNRRGHIFWLAYNPRDYLQLKLKGFSTEVIRPDRAPGPDNINRLQLDLSVKF